MKHTPTVIGNWKMNPESRRVASRLATNMKKELSGISGVEIAICPPYVYIPLLHEEFKNSKKISIGAQNVFWEMSGSYTGEVSPAQLLDQKVSHVIVGHSERRELGESNEVIAQKVERATEQDMTVILCIGEKERDEDGAYLGWLENEIKASLGGISAQYLGQIIIAYEPIWVIGGERAMESREIHEMVVFIRRTLSRIYGTNYANMPRIIYGGSVNADNIEDIMQNGEVNGVLPGRASRDPKQFAEIVKSVKKYGGR